MDKAVSHQEFQALTQDVGEMKGLLARMVEAINRISLLDERQQIVAGLLQKLDDRIGRMEGRQHEAEIVAAVNQTSASRISTLEGGYRELHIERERDKARFQTVVWMVRGLWAFAAGGGLVLAYKLMEMTK